MNFEEQELIKSIDNTSLKTITTTNFITLRNRAKKIAFSDYGSFTISLNGYTLYLDGKVISKWEAFYICPDALRIVNGKTNIHAVKRRRNGSKGIR